MTNPILAKLGFSTNDRIIVFHADDIGMCQASVAAYADLLGNSPLSSAATMVPCSWFPAAAQLFREQVDHPRLDVGVHLTLTSEWDAMRWGPMTNSVSTTSLLDNEGYFYRTTAPVQKKAELTAVSAELRTQIERAKAAQIDITHIDNHMGVMMHPRFMELYMSLGFEYGVPAFAVRLSAAQLVELGYEQKTAEQMEAFSHQLEAKRMPLFDGFHMMPLHEKQRLDERLEHAQWVLETAEPGLYYFIIHPATDTPELRALAPDWEARVGDYNLFMSDAWQQEVEESGVKVIGMKRLKELMNTEL